jgi:ABC-type enterochelin transport system ATPase subunit
MRIIKFSSIAVFVLALVGCGAKSSIVNYDASRVADADYLPLPADAPAQVDTNDITVPRLTIDVAAAETTAAQRPFTVEKVTDSFGQVSLKLNRNTAVSWELVDQALVELDIDTIDRNRSEYQFELADGQKKQSFFKRLFQKKTAPLLLVLIPSDQYTILSLESIEDELPDPKKADELFSTLLTHWSE